jgi:pyroglutamyl-peptidase
MRPDKDKLSGTTSGAGGPEPDHAAAPSAGKKKADQLAADVAVKKMAGEGGDKGSAKKQPADKPVKVLVTGYGPFDGIDPNPTAQIADKLNSIQIPGAEIVTKVLPVGWKDADKFVEKTIKHEKPDVVVSMGYSAGHHELKEFAVNHRSGADVHNKNVGYHETIDKKQDPDNALQTTLPIDRIKRDQASLEGQDNARPLEYAEEVDQGDDYLCNYIEYRELDALKGTGVEAGFLHLSDADQDFPAVVQLIRSAVADVQEQRKGGGKGAPVSDARDANPAADDPPPHGGAGG